MCVCVCVWGGGGEHLLWQAVYLLVNTDDFFNAAFHFFLMKRERRDREFIILEPDTRWPRLISAFGACVCWYENFYFAGEKDLEKENYVFFNSSSTVFVFFVFILIYHEVYG